MLNKKDLASIQKMLTLYDDVREEILALSRTATRLASSTILDIHRGDAASAADGISKVEQTLSKIASSAMNFPEFRSSQGVVVAYQEYVEASTLREFSESQKIPNMSKVRSDYRSYLLGLLDAGGEFRRMALNSLRKGDVAKAEKLLEGMEGIYDDLQTLEHTSIIPTFRVKMDAARRIIESTRGDVVTEVRRYSLEQALNRLEKRLGHHSES